MLNKLFLNSLLRRILSKLPFWGFGGILTFNNTAIREFMKYSFLILISVVFIGISAKAQEKQKLKDLLYSGKLKKDSTGVIRSTDDLSSKIDTTTKKDTIAVVKAKPADVAPMTLDQQQALVRGDAATTNTANANSSNTTTAKTADEVKTETAAPPAVASAPKTNTKLWREYTDSLTKTLKEEALKSKQVKKDTYFILVEYEIAPDGQVTVDAVNSTPGNAFLQAQIKQIMDTTPLKLNALPDNGGQGAKKVKRKQQFTITKD
jgi:hypothetical protein